MNANTPPDPYFNNIDFNPTFFQEIQQYLTEAYANSKYLKLTGGSLSGNLGIGAINPQSKLTVNPIPSNAGYDFSTSPTTTILELLY